jgi:hypothetical protein
MIVRTLAAPTTPLSLSMFEAFPSVRGGRKETVLRQAQHEPVWARVDQFDLLIIGGGDQRGGDRARCGGARLSVLLVERDDLASHTSSASSS